MARKKTISKAKSRKSTRRSSAKKTVKKQNNQKVYLIILAIAIIVATLYFKPWALQTTNEEVVASVNGELVYRADLDAEYNRLPEQLRTTLSEEAVLLQLIDRKIILVEAINAEIDVQEAVDNVLRTNNITMEELEERLEVQGMTMDEFKDQLRVFAFLDQVVFADMDVPEEELVAYYEANSQLFVIPESVTARHILVSTSNRSEEEAETIINDIKASFEENNSKFCELVTEFSEDPGSVSSCGAYPSFGRNSNFVQEYEDAAFTNEVNEASIVKTQFGYHLIQTTAKTTEEVLAFDAVKNQIRTNLLFEDQKVVFADYIDNLKQTATIINCFATPEAEVCGGPKAEEAEMKDTVDEIIEASNSLDSFASCLTDKGAKIYCAYWSSQCQGQQRMFGDSFGQLSYVECSVEGNPREQTEFCQEQGIEGYPTWEVGGQRYFGELTLGILSELTGCEL